MLIAAWFLIASNWKQYKCPVMVEWITNDSTITDVVFRRIPPPKIPHPNPRTCKYYLAWQKDCGGVLKLRVLRCRDYLGWPKYSQKYSWKRAEEMWRGHRCWGATLWRWRKRCQAREDKQPPEAGEDKGTNSLLRTHEREEPANASTLAQGNWVQNSDLQED